MTLASKGGGVGGQNQDDRVVIAYTTAMKRITGDKYLQSVYSGTGCWPATPMTSTSSISRKSPIRRASLPDPIEALRYG